MVTPEEEQKRAERLSKIIFDKMDNFIEPLNKQRGWFNREIKDGIMSDSSNRLTESDKQNLKKEAESIIECHAKSISSTGPLPDSSLNSPTS